MSQVFGRMTFLSANGGFLLLVALHFLKPELAPDWHMVSEYALGRHGWIMTLCFLALSLSCITAALAAFPLIDQTPARIGLCLLGGAAVCLLLAAIFPTDAISVRPDHAGRAAALHGLAVAIGVPALTGAALLLGLVLARRPSWTRGRMALIAFSHLTWISLALTLAVVVIRMPRSGGFGASVPVGWPNRLMFVSYFGWLASFSWPLARWRA